MKKKNKMKVHYEFSNYSIDGKSIGCFFSTGFHHFLTWSPLKRFQRFQLSNHFQGKSVLGTLGDVPVDDRFHLRNYPGFSLFRNSDTLGANYVFANTLKASFLKYPILKRFGIAPCYSFSSYIFTNDWRGVTDVRRSIRANAAIGLSM